MSTTEAFARTGDPETSHEAAAAASVNITEAQEAVLAVLKRHVSLADVELVRAYNASPEALDRPQKDSGIRTRRADLVKLGKVEWTGNYILLPGNNCRHRTWSAT